jgi:hypothetical protein
MLQWIDAVTLQPISEKLLKTDSLLNFSIAPSNNTVAQWQVIVPVGLQAVTYKVYAIAGIIPTENKKPYRYLLTGN